MIRDTQREAYYLEVLPKLKQRQQEVLKVVKDYPEGITIYEVAQKMNVLPNVISGRFGELETAGILKTVGKKIIESISKRGHTLWAINISFEEKQTTLNF